MLGRREASPTAAGAGEIPRSLSERPLPTDHLRIITAIRVVGMKRDRAIAEMSRRKGAVNREGAVAAISATPTQSVAAHLRAVEDRELAGAVQIAAHRLLRENPVAIKTLLRRRRQMEGAPTKPC